MGRERKKEREGGREGRREGGRERGREGEKKDTQSTSNLSCFLLTDRCFRNISENLKKRA